MGLEKHQELTAKILGRKRKKNLIDMFLVAVSDIKILQAANKSKTNQIKQLDDALEAMRWRTLNAHSVIEMLAPRAKASPQELAQLNVATLVVDKDGDSTAVFSDLTDLLEASNSAMKRQATVAQFRQLKGYFVIHQRAVTTILDQLDTLGKKNFVTKEDLRKLRGLRNNLELLIGRKL